MRVYLQCDMQKLTVEELKRLLYDTFCDHLSMKDIENIIMTEENHIENPEDCQVDIDSKEEPPIPSMTLCASGDIVQQRSRLDLNQGSFYVITSDC